MNDEPFFIDNKYYYSIDDLKDQIASDDCDIEDLPEDYEITATRSKLLPIIQYKAEDMAEMADEFSEQNYDQEYDLPRFASMLLIKNNNISLRDD